MESRSKIEFSRSEPLLTSFVQNSRELQNSTKEPKKKTKAAQQQESQTLSNPNRSDSISSASDPNEKQHEPLSQSSLEQDALTPDITHIFSSLQVIDINSPKVNKNDTQIEKKYDDESIGQDHTDTTKHVTSITTSDNMFKVLVENLEKKIDRCAKMVEANDRALKKLSKDAEENAKAREGISRMIDRCAEQSDANAKALDAIGRALEANFRALEKLSKKIEKFDSAEAQKNSNSVNTSDIRVKEITIELFYHLTKGIPIKGVLFDMDGTLTVPVLDFAGMRSALGIPRPLDMLEEIEKMDAEAKQRALKIIEEFEEEGKRRFELQPGIHELMEFLDHHKIPKAIITRNSQEAIEFMKTKVNFGFSLEISRDFKPFKPSPDPALHVCKTWNVDPQHCVFVGDSKDDMLCGRQAGNITVLLKQDNNKDPNIHTWTDFTVSHLIEVKKLIADGFELDKR